MRQRLITLPEQLKWTEQLIRNCSVQIEIVALAEDDDQRFVGLLGGQLKRFRVTSNCNASYTWSSAAGSIMDEGQSTGLQERDVPTYEIGEGQMELELP